MPSPHSCAAVEWGTSREGGASKVRREPNVLIIHKAAAKMSSSRKGISRPLPPRSHDYYNYRDYVSQLAPNQWLPVRLLDADQVSYMRTRLAGQGLFCGHRGGGGRTAGFHRLSYGNRRAPSVYDSRPWFYNSSVYTMNPHKKFPYHVWPYETQSIFLEPYASRMAQRMGDHKPYEINPRYPTTRGPSYCQRNLPLSSPRYHGLR